MLLGGRAAWALRHAPVAKPAPSAPDAALIGFSALAPLSWFIVASGHSYGHLQINFVLWTLPFLPFVAGYVVKSWTDAPAPASRR